MREREKKNITLHFVDFVYRRSVENEERYLLTECVEYIIKRGQRRRKSHKEIGDVDNYIMTKRNQSKRERSRRV